MSVSYEKVIEYEMSQAKLVYNLTLHAWFIEALEEEFEYSYPITPDLFDSGDSVVLFENSVIARIEFEEAHKEILQVLTEVEKEEF